MQKITKKIIAWKTVVLSSEEEIKYYALPRPKTLQSETHKIKMDTGEDVKNAYVTVSFFDGTREPYEVLVNTAVNNSLKDMQILELSARMTSLSLRHQVPLKFIIDQLHKINGQYIYSIPATLAKVLELYLTENGDNSVPTEENGDYVIVEEKKQELYSTCPQCKENKYIKQDGCAQCLACGYSQCS